MRKASLTALVALGAVGVVLCAKVARADDVSLFDGGRKPVAYIDMDDDMTIYLWEGKPVAYLAPASSDQFNVYSFNGKHLGWFAHGVVWDHSGNAACAIESRMGTTQFEPFKGLKELKPLKSLLELAPLQPAFTTSFGDTPCEFLLASGSE